MSVHPFQFNDPEIFRRGNHVLKNPSVRVQHVDEKLSIIKILLILVQRTVAIRHVKEHLVETGNTT